MSSRGSGGRHQKQLPREPASEQRLHPYKTPIRRLSIRSHHLWAHAQREVAAARRVLTAAAARHSSRAGHASQPFQHPHSASGMVQAAGAAAASMQGCMHANQRPRLPAYMASVGGSRGQLYLPWSCVQKDDWTQVAGAKEGTAPRWCHCTPDGAPITVALRKHEHCS
jgi:hypothetical protein